MVSNTRRTINNLMGTRCVPSFHNVGHNLQCYILGFKPIHNRRSAYEFLLAFRNMALSYIVSEIKRNTCILVENHDFFIPLSYNNPCWGKRFKIFSQSFYNRMRWCKVDSAIILCFRTAQARYRWTDRQTDRLRNRQYIAERILRNAR